MGTYVNPGTKNFAKDINDDFYVDKSMLIKVLNNRINRRNCYCCVSRPRRFGKTMAANMIAAYYSKGRDSHELFSNLKVSKDPSYEDNINKYTVLKLDLNGAATLFLTTLIFMIFPITLTPSLIASLLLISILIVE